MIYTVILNSNLRTSGSVGNATYNFDWTNFKEGQYIMSFGFCSGSVNIPTGDTIIVSADLGQSNVFVCSPITTRAQSSQIIGTAIQNETGVSFYYGDKNTNGPILLNRPTNNQFNVKLQTTDLIPLEITTVANYILNLSFEKV